MTNPHIGSSLASLLKEEDLHEEVELVAQKRVLAWQAEQAMHSGAAEEPRVTPSAEEQD